jgi:DNA-binding response OmpR family regulator
MVGPRILLADNLEGYLNACAEYIALAGYEVEKARNPSEARLRIEEGGIHLAVLDMRLTNNDDDKDFSGLTVAKETSPAVPKIILTAYQTWDAVREALGTADSDVPPAVDFIAKQEGLAPLLARIEKALARFVRFNWKLEIDWRVRNHFSLVKFMEPELEGERLVRRGEEFEDLFRAHFLNKSHLIVSRSLWQRDGACALIVFSFGEGTTAEAHVVVCGRRAEVEEAARRHAQFGPHAPGASGTVLERSSVTQHFAANSYALAGADLEHVVSLNEMYRTASERMLGATVMGLLQQTLGEWHQGKKLANDTLTLGDAYRRPLGLGGGEGARAALDERISLLVRQMPTLGVEVARADGRLSLRFGGQVKSYPDPVTALGRSFTSGGPTLLMKTPGRLTGENVLASPDGRTWVTDFSEAGMLPVLWNYVALETAVRFDCAEVKNIQWLYVLEQQLTGGDFSKLYVGEVEPSLRKVARTVSLIRKLASRDVNKNHADYHAGVMLHALGRLARFDPEAPLTTSELVRLAHLLLAAAMICDRLTQEPQGALANAGGGEGIRVDTQKAEVWINGERVPLRGQSYQLLLDLYTHNNELRTRRTLIENLFGETYDERDDSQVSRLNTAVRRLREKIEDDPDHPRFLLTEVNGGYRLVARPK